MLLGLIEVLSSVAMRALMGCPVASACSKTAVKLAYSARVATSPITRCSGSSAEVSIACSVQAA